MGAWLSHEDQSEVTGSISTLSDADLANVFKYLPIYDRLMVSEVCRRWYGISRTPWREVVSIDLGPIPYEHLRAIIKQCPNLRTVIAVRAQIDRKALQLLLSVPHLSVKLYNTTVSVPTLGPGDMNLFSELLSDDDIRWNSSWQEFVWHDGCVSVAGPYQDGFYAGYPPWNVSRLQLSGLRADGPYWFHTPDCGPNVLYGLQNLPNLTCLILCGTLGHCLVDAALLQDQTIYELENMPNLRELCIGCYHSGGDHAFDIDTLPLLPKLQVLFLHNVSSTSEEDLARLATAHPSLRILVITGSFCQERTIPGRRLYPNGFGSEPLPLLHVFLGKQPSEKIRFNKSSSAALRVYPISAPLPAFLESEEIASIFDGIWIAAQIKEGAKHGAALCDCGCAPAVCIRFVGDE